MTDWTDELSVAEKGLAAALNDGNPTMIAMMEAQVELEDDRRPDPPLLAAALYYASRNIAVFPLRPLRKRPLTKNGFYDATVGEEQIRAWWTDCPSANIGLPTGLFFDVVDIDGPAGVRSRLGNWAAFEALDVRAIVSTPRPGGLHYWIPPTSAGNGVKTLPGVDYRGRGGYVVAPPSVLEELPSHNPDGSRHEDGPQFAGTYSFVRAPVLGGVPA